MEHCEFMNGQSAPARIGLGVRLIAVGLGVGWWHGRTILAAGRLCRSRWRLGHACCKFLAPKPHPYSRADPSLAPPIPRSMLPTGHAPAEVRWPTVCGSEVRPCG